MHRLKLRAGAGAPPAAVPRTLAPPLPTPCALCSIPVQVLCPESFSDACCAMANDLLALTGACTSKPWCSTVNVLLAASMGVRMVQGPVGSLIGVLKAVNETVQPHHLCYTPFSALYTQQGKVPPLPLPPLAALPDFTAAAAPPQQQPSAASRQPGAPPQQLPDDHDMLWSILRRPQGELRQVDNGKAD